MTNGFIREMIQTLMYSIILDQKKVKLWWKLYDVRERLDKEDKA